MRTWMLKLSEKKIIIILVCLLAVFFANQSAFAQDDEECMECHGERDFTMERDGKEISIFVNWDHYQNSIHGENGCISCHEDIEEVPHEDELADVDCSGCHDEAAEKFDRSLHGDALKHGKFLAPTCATCHSKHNILPASNPKAKTYTMNIPTLCGSCHKDGTQVSQLRNVAERHALEDYSQSIHGDGLFRRGLLVTAVCTSCHTSHDILPHENPESTINRANIANTCTQCHVEIERVHLKVIKGELWEKQPHIIPSCIDCHQPHKVRRVFYEEAFPDKQCLACHTRPDIFKVVDGDTISLHIDETGVQHSVHRNQTCIRCHTDVNISKRPVCKDSGKVDCSNCHTGAAKDYQLSQHGQFREAGNLIAPYCTDCHGVHEMQSRQEPSSPIFARNIPDLCGRCHREGQKAAVAYKGSEHEIVENYTMSIHGKGLLQSGLMVTATCIDCHTSHRELPASDANSTVNPDNIAQTCSNCHLGIYEQYKSSVHSPLVTETDKKLPACNDCHLSHTIKRVDVDDFRQGILDQCGKCHTEVAETYFDTFHGKVSKLGAAETAKCYDCHGAHNILPPTDPNSTLSRANIVGTCKNCHENSNRKFVGYLSHATHHNKSKYPYLYYTFLFMSTLLFSTFGFFGLHTLLWVPRAMVERRKIRKHLRAKAKSNEQLPISRKKTYVQRFDPFSRFLHILVITSFLSLAITGMTIKFSGVGIFQTLSQVLGGYQVTGFIHRVAAIITFLYFFLHLGQIIYKKRKQNTPLRAMLTGDDTMLPRKNDLIEFWQTVKWFLGIGPRPNYGRWTYWEKFDYFAVFWGVTIIGSSGLMLWFPELFTHIGLPGWLINVATIIHSDEALLATGFIFTVHFFNTHFRPDKFPMDPVIFTGNVELEELKADRPRQYAELMKSRKIGKMVTEAPPAWLEKGAKIIGFTFLGIGISIIVMIIYAMIFLYQ